MAASSDRMRHQRINSLWRSSRMGTCPLKLEASTRAAWMWLSRTKGLRRTDLLLLRNMSPTQARANLLEVLKVWDFLWTKTLADSHLLMNQSQRLLFSCVSTMVSVPQSLWIYITESLIFMNMWCKQLQWMEIINWSSASLLNLWLIQAKQLKKLVLRMLQSLKRSYDVCWITYLNE